jgi:putative transposase
MCMVNIIHNRNCVFQVAYHVIWCSKYRKQILVDKIAIHMSNLIDEICKKNDWFVITTEIQPDHIHLFLTIPPAIAVATAVKILKGTTARKLFLKFPQLKKEL